MRPFAVLALTGLFARPAWSFLAPRSQVKAPVHLPDDPKDIIHGEVLVNFKENHTIEDHYDNIGINISAIATKFQIWPTLGVYHATFSEANASVIEDHIRYDQYVDHVVRNYFVTWERDHTVHNTTTHPGPDKRGQFPSGATKHNSAELDEGRKLSKKHDTMEDDSVMWNYAMISAGKRLDDLGTDPTDFREHTAHWLKEAGYGVNVYVIDTGVNLDHETWARRAAGEVTNFKGLKGTDPSPYCSDGETMHDIEGHGTHVASIIAGGNHGWGSVAPRARIISVKAFCNGAKDNIFGFMRAVLDITEEHETYARLKPRGFRGSVVNISMGFKAPKQPDRDLLHTYLVKATNLGIPVFAAAGNAGVAKLVWPSSDSKVYSVGNSNIEYKPFKSRFGASNYHRKLSIWAPGQAIYSAFIKGDEEEYANDNEAYRFISGTSQACPHVAGVAAAWVGYLGVQNILDADNIYDRISMESIPVIAWDEDTAYERVTKNLVQGALTSQTVRTGRRRAEREDAPDGEIHLEDRVLESRGLPPLSDEPYDEAGYYDGHEEHIDFDMWDDQTVYPHRPSEEDGDKGYFPDYVYVTPPSSVTLSPGTTTLPAAFPNASVTVCECPE